MLAFFLGHTEIIVILIIALLLFGTRLPKVARSLGQGIKEFKGGLRDTLQRAMLERKLARVFPRTEFATATVQGRATDSAHGQDVLFSGRQLRGFGECVFKQCGHG